MSHKYKGYGKGYTRTFDRKEKGLLFQQHHGGLQCPDGRRGRRKEKLSTTCRIIGKWHGYHEKSHHKTVHINIRQQKIK